MAIIGYNGSYSSTTAGKFWITSKYSAPVSGFISKIKVYITLGNYTGRKIAVGIYNDNGGVVGTLINNSSNIDVTANFSGWLEIDIPTTEIVTDSVYWIISQVNDGGFTFYNATGSTQQRAYKASFTFPYWASPPTGLTYDNYKILIYSEITEIQTIQKTIASNTKIKVLDNQQTITSNAGVILDRMQKIITSNTRILGTYQKTIASNTKIKVLDNQQTITSNAKVGYRTSKTIISDAKVEIEYNSKFIHNSNAFIVTDTNPAQIIKVDLANPTSYSKYIISDKQNAKDLVINHDREIIYVSLKNGYVAKIDTDDCSIQSFEYIGENQQLYSICHNPDYLTTFIADAIADQSLFVIDEAIYSKINTDIRTREEEQKLIKTFINIKFGSKINTDLRLRKQEDSTINTDLRVIKYNYNEEIPLARTDFHIYIDDIELGNDDLKLDSITITHTIDNKSNAQFILLRKHDDINNPTTIVNNNNVKIYLGTALEFEGKINKIDCRSEEETVQVYCETEEINENYNITLKELPLSSLNTQIHLYDILVNNIDIDNPYIAIDDENPKYYKGIKVNLGTFIQEKSITWFESPLVDEIEDGSFKYAPNFTYFWMVNIEWIPIEELGGRGLISGWRYIGTSLAPLSGDLYDIIDVANVHQILSDDYEQELGYFTVGEAPFNEISVKNGKKTSAIHYEDGEDALYLVEPPSYDYIQYAKDVANYEYNKLKNINGQILPKTFANIDLTIDNYLYNELKLLTKINITNTITENIYKNANGFPLSIKQIIIDSSSMKVNIVASNEKSEYESNLLDGEYPVEPVENFGFKSFVDSKFDLANWEEVEYPAGFISEIKGTDEYPTGFLSEMEEE